MTVRERDCAVIFLVDSRVDGRYEQSGSLFARRKNGRAAKQAGFRRVIVLSGMNHFIIINGEEGYESCDEDGIRKTHACFLLRSGCTHWAGKRRMQYRY
jgi:hypothetical protein